MKIIFKISVVISLFAMFSLVLPAHAIDNDDNIFNYNYQYPFTAGAEGNGNSHSNNSMQCYVPGEYECNFRIGNYKVCQPNKKWTPWKIMNPNQNTELAAKCMQKH
ncbi:MAG: hypothetical protein HY877_05690 [Deltaproteobacteria bacterium]|nr:hypothetical protein [Deltaproteobacteria bacterium]